MLPGSQNLAAGQEVPLLASEVRHLRAEMAQLQHSVAQLQEAETFHRTLGERAAPPKVGPSPGA